MATVARNDTQDDLGPRSFTRFSVEPLTARIGAEIGGVDLGAQLDDEMVADIRAALLTWKVIFFRDQDITEDQHIAFARRFGELEVHPVTPKDQPHQEIFHLKTRPGGRTGADLWHSDVTWRETPSLGSVLRARIMPEVGGDTMFSDMVAAYEGLSPAMKDWVCSLTAVHDGSLFAVMQGKTRESFWEEFPVQRHPVVRTHPETGERATLCQLRLHHPYRGAGQEGERLAARSPLQPGRDPGIPVPFPLEGKLGRLLGQPCVPALCGQRLRPGDAGDGAGDGDRRQAVFRSGSVGTRPNRKRHPELVSGSIMRFAPREQLRRQPRAIVAQGWLSTRASECDGAMDPETSSG